MEVIYNGDALEQSFVHSTIEAALAQANLELSNQIRRVAAQVIGALVRGGNLGVAGAPQNLPGLGEIPGILRRIIARHPHGADRAQLERLAEFSEFAAQNLGVSQRRAEHREPADPGHATRPARAVARRWMPTP